MAAKKPRWYAPSTLVGYCFDLICSFVGWKSLSSLGLNIIVSSKIYVPGTVILTVPFLNDSLLSNILAYGVFLL